MTVNRLFLLTLAVIMLVNTVFCQSVLAENQSNDTKATYSKSANWRLDDLYSSDDQWEQDFRKVQDSLGEAEKYHGKFSKSAKSLLKVLQISDRIQALFDRVYSYASMRLDEDNTNPTYQSLKDRATGLYTQVNTTLSFIVPEIQTIPNETMQRFIQEEKGLVTYKFFLDELFRQKNHTLSAEEEQIIAQAGDLAQAPGQIFQMLNYADMTFPSIKDEKGNEVAVTKGNYGSLLSNSDRRVRKDAFTSVYSSYGMQKNTLAAVLGSSVKGDVFGARVHKYPSALEASLFADNVPPAVYDNLIQTVRQNLDVLHRYTALRKKLLGYDELHMYDLYVPIVRGVNWKFTYSEAAEVLKKGLAPLDEDYISNMSKGLDSGWVDVYERKGKTSGAYALSPYGVHPYILLNYNGNVEDLFTLSHEMGHAMNYHYTQEKQPYVYSESSIFTAEVASTLNESLLLDYLLKTATDQDKKLYLLNYQLEQIRTTLFRQTMFAEFEKIIHQKSEAGEALTADLLCQIYHQLNVDYYGAETVIDEDIDLEWARVPHFYNSFYVYKYATGLSAATSLTKQILSEGEPAVSRYLDFLSKGSSDQPLNLLKTAGVDMTSSQPVLDTIKLFSERLDEMERLAAK